MHDLVAHIESFLSTYQAERVIIACSAGLDSTVLLHTCSQLNITVEMAHVNYQLRGEASEQDQQFLEQLSEQLQLPLHVKRIRLEQELKHGGNLQEKARDHRYRFFKTLLQKDKTKRSFVLLAHHREDQTETFFMNLNRNAGVMGLSAMPPKRGSYLRPLLSFSKEKLRTYALNNALSWREDASNNSVNYARNAWRNVLLPQLRTSIPDLDNAVAVLVALFQEKQQALQTKVAQIWKDIQQHETLSVTQFQSLDFLEIIELCRQMSQPLGIAETWLKLKHKGTGIELQPTPTHPFHRVVYDGDSFSFLSQTSPPLPLLQKVHVQSLPETFNKKEIYLDASRISGTLHLRSVRKGDRIHPIGMKGSRLVSDVVSDAKLTALQKQHLCVLSDDNYVLWIPELCISRKAIASKQTKRILKVRLDSVLK